MTTTTTAPADSSRFHAKPDQILAGLIALESTRKRGQTFSFREIAAACGVNHRAIQFIANKAMYKVAVGLRKQCPELFEEQLGSKQAVQKFFSRLSPNAYLAGGTNCGRLGKQRKITRAKSCTRPPRGVTLHSVSSLLSQRAGRKSFTEQRDLRIVRATQTAAQTAAA